MQSNGTKLLHQSCEVISYQRVLFIQVLFTFVIVGELNKAMLFPIYECGYYRKSKKKYDVMPPKINFRYSSLTPTLCGSIYIGKRRDKMYIRKHGLLRHLTEEVSRLYGHRDATRIVHCVDVYIYTHTFPVIASCIVEMRLRHVRNSVGIGGWMLMWQSVRWFWISIFWGCVVSI